MLRHQPDCLADGAEVRFDGYMDIIGNYMEVSGVGSIGISIERSFLTGYIDSWIEMILSVSIECNEVVMFNAASGQGMHICSTSRSPLAIRPLPHCCRQRI